LPIPAETLLRLKRAGLIEARKHHIHVSTDVAAATATKAGYIHARAQDDDVYAKLLTDYLKEFGEASRAEIDDLLLNKLSDALTKAEKAAKIDNFLTKLRRNGVIANLGPKKQPRWRLAE
jgi:ATP-dependent DNA helicase RecG